ncbi:HAD family hydrolase [Skermanella stibiiresistens SB22]|uniref:phosphoglycolate phosphatase n=1 Tax=Skermanella stibiiresistens SB22 TaxID=1385369 RepID=W9HC43_9PROT|nr:HAD hydrolase-like protein [Skermanella stibiiresistens]EWY42262.1 HAD family hydrolase [Skermanella stibiiresistens SB22]
MRVADTGPEEPDRLPRAVLFDWDNTLVDNWGCIHAALNAALVAHDLPPWTLEETRVRVRQSLRDSFPRLFGDRWTDARDIFYDHFGRHHLDYLKPLPGAEDLLKALSDGGVYLGVVSNKTGRFLRAESAQLGWDRYFGKLVGAGDAPHDKPAVDPIHMALAPGGFPAGPDVWFVGDADVDMQCAHAAGCLPMLIGDGPDDFGDFPPAHRFGGCGIVSDLVRRLRTTISLESPVERSE